MREAQNLSILGIELRPRTIIVDLRDEPSARNLRAILDGAEQLHLVVSPRDDDMALESFRRSLRRHRASQRARRTRLAAAG